MIPAEEAALIAGLRGESARLYKQATSIEFDAQELEYQAREIENRFEFQGPCVGCPRYRSCSLSRSCAAMDQCKMARELAGVDDVVRCL
jgi:hypothetical protein